MKTRQSISGHDPYNSADTLRICRRIDRSEFTANCELLRAQAGATEEDRARPITQEKFDHAYLHYLIARAELRTASRLCFNDSSKTVGIARTDPDLYMCRE
jgi:hypothetical protein